MVAVVPVRQVIELASALPRGSVGRKLSRRSYHKPHEIELERKRTRERKRERERDLC